MPVGTKRKNSKINAKPFWFNSRTGQSIPAGTTLTATQKKDLEYFDSVLEFQIYGKLCRKYNPSFVRRQHQILVLPENDYFPELTWKVDFTVFTPQGLLLFEGKGRWILHDNFALGDFRKLLRMLQLIHPDYFNYLQIVSEEAWRLPGTNLNAIALKDL